MSGHLDDLLPDELKPANALLSKANRSEADAGSSADDETDPGTHETETTPMNGQQTQALAAVTSPLLTSEQQEQIRTLASQEAAKIIAAKDSEVQVAKTIEKLSTESATAKAEANASKLAADQQKTVAADLQSKLDAATTELAEAKKTITAKDAEVDDFKKKFTKAKADLDEVNAKLAKAAIEKAIGDRTAALKDAGLADSSFAKRAVATNEDGSLKMDDTNFTDTLADLKAVKPAEAAATDDKSKTDAAAQQAAATQATASTTNANGAAPAAPDLSAVGGYQMATAALANGAPAPVQSGVSKFAAAI